MDRSSARQKYASQKSRAKQHGIGWELTFDQWLAWWGSDLARRGSGPNSLQMQRPADTGPYALGNIRKGTPRDNMKTAANMKRLRATMKAKADLEAARDASEPSPSEDWLDEDEQELQQMFGVRSSVNYPVIFKAEKLKL